MAKSTEKPPKVLGYRYHSPNIPLSAIRSYARKTTLKSDTHAVTTRFRTV
jgi:hypothetical protein